MTQKMGLRICNYFSRELTPHNVFVVLTNLSGTLRNEFGEDTTRAVDLKQEWLDLKSIIHFNSRKWKHNQGASVAMAESLGWKLSEIKKSLRNLQKPKT